MEPGYHCKAIIGNAVERLDGKACNLPVPLETIDN